MTQGFKMPDLYQSGGTPLQWQDDVSGVLPTAVKTFFQWSGYQQPLTPGHLQMIREYCRYYINAPCWQIGGMEQQFAELRQRVTHLQTSEEIETWCLDALEVGIDPF